MALTVTINDSTVFGNKRVVAATVDFDASYPTGGEPLTAADLGLSQVDFGFASVSAAATTTVNVAEVHFDAANETVLLFDETPAQVANAADMAGLSAQVVVFGS